MSTYFSEVSDFRVQGGCLHLLSDVLGLILCGVLADCDDYLEIVDYGKDKITFLRTELGFIFPHGIPSEDTLERIMRKLNPSNVARCFKECLTGLHDSKKLLNIDGKSLRGTIPKGKKQAKVQMINVWCEEHKLSFGQYQVDEKSNEIVAIPALLEQTNCENSIITIDAMGCQRAITFKIIEKGADYIIGLKENQGNLFGGGKYLYVGTKNKFTL